LERLATAVGLPPFLLAPTAAFIRRLREAMADSAVPDAAPDDSAGLRPETKRAVLEALDRAAAQARAELKLHAASRAAVAGSSESDPVP
jgi:hypothetical protein